MSNVAIRAISVCTGYGGLELGLRLAGLPVRVVAAVERQAYAAAVLAHHMELGDLDPCPIWDDMESFNGAAFSGRVDLVVGGIPCQGASVAGKRRGIDDERWLWPTFRRIVEQSGASMLLLENVPGLLNVNEGRAFAEVIDDLAARGWVAEWDCFRASSVGAPHLRDRVFILAADPNGNAFGQLEQWLEQRQTVERHAELGNDGSARDGVPDADRERLQAIARAIEPQPDRGQDATRGDRATPTANADSGRLQGERDGGQLDQGERTQRRYDADRCNVSPRWSSVVGWPSPEPAFRRVDDGSADGLDFAWHERLHLLGNGVVPQAAAQAFVTLAQRLLLQ